MMTSMKVGAFLIAAVAAVTTPCTLCRPDAGRAHAATASTGTLVSAWTPAMAWASAQGGTQRADTATLRLHISGMTCGSCPTTARLALRRVDGVYDATVTLDDSLGVVRYDPKRVTPLRIAEGLTRLTGYGAKLLGDTTRAPRRGGR